MKITNIGKPSIKNLSKIETDIFVSSLLVEILEWKKNRDTCSKTSTLNNPITPTKKDNKNDTK